MPRSLEIDTDLLQSAIDILDSATVLLEAEHRAVQGARQYTAHESGCGSGTVGAALHLALRRRDELMAFQAAIAQSFARTSESLTWALGCFDASELQCTPR